MISRVAASAELRLHEDVHDVFDVFILTVRDGIEFGELSLESPDIILIHFALDTAHTVGYSTS